MKKEHSDQHKTDSLIRQVLKDDLPPALEEKMKERILRFRKEIEQPRQIRRRNLSVGWIFRKEVLAGASVLMLVSGGALQLIGYRSALADTVSALNTSVSVMDRIGHTGTMECQIEIPGDNGLALSYTIRWLSPNLVRVDAHKSDKMNKTLWVSESGIIIADHIHNTTEKAEGVWKITDATFRPVLWLMTPEELAERLYGKWKLRLYEQTDKPDQGLFIFLDQEEKAVLEMTVDLNTYLPLRIEKFLPESPELDEKGRSVMQAHFNWNQPVSPQIMIPKTLSKNHDVV